MLAGISLQTSLETTAKMTCFHFAFCTVLCDITIQLKPTKRTM